MLSKIISLFLVISLVMATSIYAHSGGTNSEGCHSDNINGGYHCHNSSGNSSDSDLSVLVAAGIIVAVVAIVWAVNKDWGSKRTTLTTIEKLPIHVGLSSNIENNGINGSLQLSQLF
ncbi:MAG: YHYH domain-containing protein [Nitrospirae bacterium]|nr:YHYH domain-containing protein [Nitrospirota bacterium]